MTPEPAAAAESEPPKTSIGVQPMPEHFVAWGRLFGGLAISVFGALGLHAIQNKDVNAFSIVASVSGLVLNGWGFAATNLSPKARREDVLWAWLLFGLLLVSLAANAYYNRHDYGFAFIGIELLAIALAAALGLLAYALAGFFFKHGRQPEFERRGRRLIAMMACALLFWPLLRWPLLALALAGAIGPGEEGDAEIITTAAMRRDMNAPLLRWAVHVALKSEYADRRARGIDASRTGKLLDASELTAIVLNDPSEFVRTDALGTLTLQDSSAARHALMESIRIGNAINTFFHTDLLATLSPEQLDVLFDNSYAANALASAYYYGMSPVLFGAVKKWGMTKTVEFCFKVSPHAIHEGDRHSVARKIFANSGVRDQAELFKFWDSTAFKNYFSKPDMNTLWANYPSGARNVFEMAFQSSDSKVLDAAYQNLLSSLSNPQALHSLVEPAEGSPEERLRAACKKLSHSLAIFRTRRVQNQD